MSQKTYSWLRLKTRSKHAFGIQFERCRNSAPAAEKLFSFDYRLAADLKRWRIRRHHVSRRGIHYYKAPAPPAFTSKIFRSWRASIVLNGRTYPRATPSNLAND